MPWVSCHSVLAEFLSLDPQTALWLALDWLLLIEMGRNSGYDKKPVFPWSGAVGLSQPLRCPWDGPWCLYFVEVNLQFPFRRTDYKREADNCTYSLLPWILHEVIPTTPPHPILLLSVFSGEWKGFIPRVDFYIICGLWGLPGTVMILTGSIISAIYICFLLTRDYFPTDCCFSTLE